MVKKVTFMANGKKVSFGVTGVKRKVQRAESRFAERFEKAYEKERREHPWLTAKQAERVVRDHHGRRY
jgi:hypothetical protein